MVILAVIFGALSITKIRSLSGSNKIQTDQIVLPYLMIQDDFMWVNNDQIPLVAPLAMRFQLNKEQFDRNILPGIGANNPIASFSLDCGNGQIIYGSPLMYERADFF